jgi:GT2 family glycosyltransferase
VRRILVDDGSSDPEIATLLDAWSTQPNVTIERHARNRGYTRAVNTGIAAAGGADVVLLNSDTEVGPRWIESLRIAAWCDATIGTVTAVSDNAGAFSVPELEQYCPIPARWSLVEAQRALLQGAGLRRPELPTGNGFCLYVKGEVIARIGAMDADAFPAGYGEENDFCQRAIAAGWRNVIAGNVLVRHERSASFGDARRAELGRRGMAVLRERWPRYEADVGATLFGFDRLVLDYRVRRIYAEPGRGPRARVLAVVAQAGAIGQRADEDVVALVDGADPPLYRIDADGAALALPLAVDSPDRLAAALVALGIERVEAGKGTGVAEAVVAAALALGIPCDAKPLP